MMIRRESRFMPVLKALACVGFAIGSGLLCGRVMVMLIETIG